MTMEAFAVMVIVFSSQICHVLSSTTIVGVSSTSWFHNRSLLSPPYSQFLGEQPIGRTVSAPIVIVKHQCDADKVDTNAVRGKIVFLPGGACSPTQVYDMLAGMEAVGVIWWSIRGGLFHNARSDSGNESKDVLARRNAIPFLAVDLPNDEAKWLVKVLNGDNHGLIATLTADPNTRWTTMFRSWWYQLFGRILPATLFATATILASLFLYRHALLTYDDYLRRYPFAASRTRLQCFWFMFGSITFAHVALMLEIVSTMVLAVFIAVGGLRSTANLHYSITTYFGYSLLAGIGCGSLLMTATVWNRIVALSSSWSTKGFIRKYGVLLIGFIVAAVIILDLIVPLFYVLYYNFKTASFSSINLWAHSVIEGICGLFFVYSSFTFQRTIRSSVSSRSSSLNATLRRQSFLALIIGVTVLFNLIRQFVIGFGLFSVVFEWSIANQWGATRAFGAIIRALQSLCCTLILRPRCRNGTVKPVLDHKLSTKKSQSSSIARSVVSDEETLV